MANIERNSLEEDLERRLLHASGADTEDKVQEYKSKLDILSDRFHAFLENKNYDPRNSLHLAIQLYNHMFENSENRFSKDYKITDVIDAQLSGKKKAGNCLGLTALYSLLGLRHGLNLKTRVCEARGSNDPGHIYSVLEYGSNKIAMEHTKKKRLGFEHKGYKEEPLERLIAETHSGNARELLKKKKFSKAISEYQKAIRLAPGNTNLVNNLAVVKAYTGRPSEAVKLLNKCLAKDPKNELYKKNLEKAKKKLVNRRVSFI